MAPIEPIGINQQFQIQPTQKPELNFTGSGRRSNELFTVVGLEACLNLELLGINPLLPLLPRNLIR
jgi:hypothetical protein